MSTNKVKRGDAFERILNRRIEEALAEKQRTFQTVHAEDSDETLLNYVKHYAEEMKRSPNSNEVIGGNYLKERFGSWETLLEKAGLPPAGRAADFKNRYIYKQERERQLVLWREEKARKQAEKKQRQLEKTKRKASNKGE